MDAILALIVFMVAIITLLQAVIMVNIADIREVLKMDQRRGDAEGD